MNARAGARGGASYMYMCMYLSGSLTIKREHRRSHGFSPQGTGHFGRRAELAVRSGCCSSVVWKPAKGCSYQPAEGFIG